ncbi:50S ribosomal protein L35, chloroplastic-like [Camellia sinensis]|nr:50S ribosomal protein L35, chloroplastic-like [Camellia sinensis]
MASSSTTFSFAFKVSPPIARSSTTSLRTSPTIVRLSQFTKKSSVNLSSSHTIPGFSPILPRLTFPTQIPQSLTVISAKRYKMKTHKASAKRFRVTGSGKIIRRRAG